MFFFISQLAGWITAIVVLSGGVYLASTQKFGHPWLTFVAGWVTISLGILFAIGMFDYPELVGTGGTLVISSPQLVLTSFAFTALLGCVREYRSPKK